MILKEEKCVPYTVKLSCKFHFLLENVEYSFSIFGECSGRVLVDNKFDFGFKMVQCYEIVAQ